MAMMDGSDDGFKKKPVVTTAPNKDDKTVKLCYCTLACQFCIGTQDQLCEVCDCSEEFNPENVQRAFQHLEAEINTLRGRINLQEVKNG